MMRGLWRMGVLSLLLMACGSQTPPPSLQGGPDVVEGGAVFRLRAPSARTVYLVGDFNGWNPRTDPMTDENGDGEWSLFYPLSPGRYAYKYVMDGRRWLPDPTNPIAESDGFDGQNSIVVIPSAN